jgi:Ca-activated chloride channel family protein
MNMPLQTVLIISLLILSGCAEQGEPNNAKPASNEQKTILEQDELAKRRSEQVVSLPELTKANNTASAHGRAKPITLTAAQVSLEEKSDQHQTFNNAVANSSMPGLARTSAKPLAKPLAKTTQKKLLKYSTRQIAQVQHRNMSQVATNTENYSHVAHNQTLLVTDKPVSTFSIDVDTAAYANVRRVLNQGMLPQVDSVRIEELINYFSYDYQQPTQQPFSVYTEVGPSPFNQDKHLLHIGIKGKQIDHAERPPSNLVFLIDVSGSMNHANKLGLLKNALKMLTNQLSASDTVAIVVYAGAAGTVLKPTSGDNKQAIHDALAKLSAGGATNGGAAIDAAYRLAQQSFIRGGINRVILATDGDFNLGTVNQHALKNLIASKRKFGIALSVLGFGMGNYNDSLMQDLAQNGNGNAYYIDNLLEARKVLVEELSATLMIIAKDVKIQVEFNPVVVSEYRLIGYETRALLREDFNNDRVDAGEIGAGHTVTAIFEIS